VECSFIAARANICRRALQSVLETILEFLSPTELKAATWHRLRHQVPEAVLAKEWKNQPSEPHRLAELSLPFIPYDRSRTQA